MSVRRRKWETSDGETQEAWVVTYSDTSTGQRRRHLKTFDKKKDADAFHDRVREDIRAGVHTSSRVTVAMAGSDWLKTCEANNLERSTWESYRQHLFAHIIPHLGAMKLSQLSVPLVRVFMDKLRAAGHSPAMVKRLVMDLGSILADAQERGNVAQNVVRSVRRKGGQQERKKKLEVGVDIPTREEVRALVEHLEGRWRPLLLTAIFTGLRASELRGLRWNDVDFKKGELHVRQRADRYNAIGAPKSAAGTRTVPLAPIVANTLREWKLKNKHDLVFPTGTGGVENHSNIVQRGFMPAQVAAGITDAKGKAKYSGLHALRHFYASWCINRRADGGLELPLKNVSERLGHSSIQITADRYGHLFPRSDDGGELAAAQKKLLG
jgi:integrase